MAIWRAKREKSLANSHVQHPELPNGVLAGSRTTIQGNQGISPRRRIVSAENLRVLWLSRREIGWMARTGQLLAQIVDHGEVASEQSQILVQGRCQVANIRLLGLLIDDLRL